MIGKSLAAGAARTLLLTALLTGVVSAAHATVTISKKPTKNVSCAAGVCAPTKAKANLNATDLANLLATGDTKVVSDNKAVDIEITDAVSWASPTRLTLDSYHSITFEAPVTVAGTGAGLTITTNDGGSDGDLMFDGKGNLTFWDLSSGFVINGSSYTLFADIASLASAIANNASGHYALANNYDASVDGSYKHSPIATELTGTFDGLGHVISNLSIESDSAAALFNRASGTLRDIGLTNVDIVSSGSAASLLAEDDAATIIGCHATGTVHGGTAGGLIAQGNSAGGRIIRSHVAADVYATEYAGAAGGLVGVSLYPLNISLSHASGRVGGANITGGLVAVMAGGSISQSFATARVSGELEAGGLVGHFIDGSIQDSYATGEVGSREVEHVGGLAGWIESSSTVHSSYAAGMVKRGSYKHADRGGFVGTAESGDDFAWDYWDVDTSGMTQGCGSGDCNGVTGQSDAQMKSALPAGFDPAVWGQDPNINNGYPYLLANPPPK